MKDPPPPALEKKFSNRYSFFECPSCKTVRSAKYFKVKSGEIKSYCMFCRFNNDDLYEKVEVNKYRDNKVEKKLVKCLGHCGLFFKSQKGERICRGCKKVNRQFGMEEFL